MVTIIADEGQHGIGAALYEEFSTKGIQAEYISLENIEVKPCLGCNGCTYQTYGKCVFRDDGDRIYPHIIRADALIFVTPIVFGSYSFKIKRVFDKFGLIMDRHYFMRNKELAKGGLVGRQFKFFAIGVAEDCVEGEIEAFQKLFHENLVITRGAGKAFIADGPLSKTIRTQIINEVLSV